MDLHCLYIFLWPRIRNKGSWKTFSNSDMERIQSDYVRRVAVGIWWDRRKVRKTGEVSCQEYTKKRSSGMTFQWLNSCCKHYQSHFISSQTLE